MSRREVEQLLRKHGFSPVRIGSRHIIWEAGNYRLVTSRSASIAPRTLQSMKSVLRRIEQGLPTAAGLHGRIYDDLWEVWKRSPGAKDS